MIKTYSTIQKMGHLSHAFILSFFHLALYRKFQLPDFYKLSMSQIIQLGGDTDTNACIAGGLIGALVGVSNIPEQMVKKIIQFDCVKVKKDKSGNNIGRPRPEFLSIKKHGIEFIKKLLRCQPLTLEDGPKSYITK